MEPTIGRIVHYTLSADDAEQINRRRTTGAAIAERIAAGTWPIGAQAHIGNDVKPGEVVPMLIVQTWGGSTVNGRAFLDGTDELWVTTSVAEGTGPRTWAWPPRQ